MKLRYLSGSELFWCMVLPLTVSFLIRFGWLSMLVFFLLAMVIFLLAKLTPQWVEQRPTVIDWVMKSTSNQCISLCSVVFIGEFMIFHSIAFTIISSIASILTMYALMEETNKLDTKDLVDKK